MEDLATVYAPKAVEVEMSGGTFTVSPLTVGQIPSFARAIRPIAPALQGGEADWLGLLADHGDAVIAAVSIASSITPKDLAALGPDEFVALATACMEVNMDFFVRRLTPAVSAAAERILAASGAGATRSKL